MSRENYKAAGVDVEAGYEAVKLMKEHVARTKIPGVIGGLGGFGGLFELDLSQYKEPVLVSGTDGVGTKLKIAMLMDKCDTVGQDCVAMCVNDIICSGAKPLFFLDYIAVGKNVPQRVADIVKGVADGCVYGGCALVGGETAEMPGFYDPEEYDIAGFAVGVVDKSKIIDGKGMKKGNKVIGIASTGVHSNGFSLVRKVFHLNDERGDTLLKQKFEQLGEATLGETLLTPTKIYVKQMLAIMEKMTVHGISHITGGGFYENLPRMLPDGLAIRVEKDSFPVLPIFRLLQDAARMSEDEMFHTFNMGIGMAFVVDSEDAETALTMLREMGEDAYIIGEITEGDKEVTIC